MSRLGAKKLKERRLWGADWVYNPPERKDGEVLVFSGPNGFMATGGGGTFQPEDRIYTEEEVKIACEWGLVFMLLWGDRNKAEWALDCMEVAASFPSGSYRNVFWWAARTLCNEREHDPFTLDDFREYLKNKWADFNEGMCHRDGPIW